MQNDMQIDGNKISTWHSPHIEQGLWLAVNMTAAVKMLDGYNLTDDEKTDLSCLMAGYCRLIGEAGLTGYGDSELDAISDLFGKAKGRTMGCGQTPEQEARDMLESMGISNAQAMSAGEVVELANLIARYNTLKALYNADTNNPP